VAGRYQRSAETHCLHFQVYSLKERTKRWYLPKAHRALRPRLPTSTSQHFFTLIAASAIRNESTTDDDSCGNIPAGQTCHTLHSSLWNDDWQGPLWEKFSSYSTFCTTNHTWNILRLRPELRHENTAYSRQRYWPVRNCINLSSLISMWDRIFIFVTTNRPALVTTQAPIQWPAGLFPWE
jgi:hypothetical protein